jgi:hypothetical protein
LAASLRPEPDERFLHLGSGDGRAVLAWSLLLPRAAACGVEANSVLHRAALAAHSQLDPSVQQRIFLHNGDLFAIRNDWCQASIILISTANFNDEFAERVADGLRSVKAGTRVISISRSLPGLQLSGLTFAKEAIYRTAGGGNVTAYIYRK